MNIIKMIFFIFGFEWCELFKDICQRFEKSSYRYYSVSFEDAAEMAKYIAKLCNKKHQMGVYGLTSPQIFRVDDLSVVCLGGHDDVVPVFDHLLECGPRKQSYF